MKGTLVLGLALVAAGWLASADDVVVDPAHSSVNFTIKHLSISNVKGSFTEFAGAWQYDPATKLLTALNGTVKATAVDTNSEARDKHLRSEDFFDVAKTPEMKFKLLKHVVADGKGRVVGELTIRGVTKPVELTAEVSDIVPNPMDGGKTRRQAISLNGEVNRKDFGVGAKFADSILSEKVSVSIDLEGEVAAK